MSSSRRRNPDRRRSAARPKPREDDDLPTLEPIDEEPGEAGAAAEEFDELEPIDDDQGVEVALAMGADPGFDVTVAVTVAAMPKDRIAAAVEGPLRRSAAAERERLRWQRVLVRFGGEAVVGSAVKQLVADTLAPFRPLSVVVRRGFGDELVHEGTLPSVQSKIRGDGERLQVEIGGEVDAEDLGTAVERVLPPILEQASGRSVALAFRMRSGPNATLRSSLQRALREAGALRATIDGGDLLFDTELEARVSVETSGDRVTVQVRPADDAAVTGAALALVLPEMRERIAGANVTVRFAERQPTDAELSALIALCNQLGAARVELDRGDAPPDLLLPRMLRLVTRGEQTLLGVQPDDRDPRTIPAAFAREAADLHEAIADHHVTVDWPAGFELDRATELACLDEAIGAHRPASIACSFGGADREPFRPEPVSFRTETSGAGSLRVMRIDSEAGKPAELTRAIERAIARERAALRGLAVRAEITGRGAVSRSMLRTLRDALANALVARFETEENGTVDVVLPPLLGIEPEGAKSFRVTADDGGRDAGQVAAALARELDATDLPPGVAFRVAPTPLADEIVAALVARGAASVLLDGPTPIRLHPPLFTLEPAGERLVLHAAPGADDAITLAQVDHELPRLLDRLGPLDDRDVTIVWHDDSLPRPEPLARTIALLIGANPRRLALDSGSGEQQLHPAFVPDHAIVLARNESLSPPLVLLAVDRGAEPEHVGQVERRLGELLPELEGRRVLLVLRDHGREIGGEDDSLAAARRIVEPAAAATLVFRGEDPHGRPFFEVVHSTLDALPVGTRVRDPRGR